MGCTMTCLRNQKLQHLTPTHLLFLFHFCNSLQNQTSNSKFQTSNFSIMDKERRDMCPVCKTDRYLNPNMQFVINTECYHKICDNCADRIFGNGPAPCPYPNCGKTLRRNKFKSQQFEDIGIEREVDIRRRVLSIHNKVENDFPDLDSYNNYLELIEDIIFNIYNNIDKEKIENDLSLYQQQHKNEITSNYNRQKEDAKREIEEERTKKILQNESLRLQYEIDLKDKLLRNNVKKDFINRLMTNSNNEDPNLIYKRLQEKVSNTSNENRKNAEYSTNYVKKKLGASRNNQFNIDDNIVFSPFNGDRQLEIDLQYQLKSEYFDPYVNELANKPEYKASGFKVEQAFRHALEEAFIGIGCNIEEEKVIKT